MDGGFDDPAYAGLMHGNETLVVHEGEEAHDKLAIHAVGDATVTGNGFAEIFDLERSFEARGEKPAERRDEGGKGREGEDVELHGRDVDDAGEKSQGRESVGVRDEDRVGGAGEAGEDVGSEILGGANG